MPNGVEHYDNGEQTVQVPCVDGEMASFHVEEETTRRLRITVYPDQDFEPLITVQVSPEVARQMILALNRPDFLRALGGW